jgi:hypothetical protein
MGGLFGAPACSSRVSDDLLRTASAAGALGEFSSGGQGGRGNRHLISLGLVAAMQTGMLEQLLGEEPELEGPQLRTSIGPNAIPPPQWGRRP